MWHFWNEERAAARELRGMGRRGGRRSAPPRWVRPGKAVRPGGRLQGAVRRRAGGTEAMPAWGCCGASGCRGWSSSARSRACMSVSVARRSSPGTSRSCSPRASSVSASPLSAARCSCSAKASASKPRRAYGGGAIGRSGAVGLASAGVTAAPCPSSPSAAGAGAGAAGGLARQRSIALALSAAVGA